ncbi:MAG: hypothetical protein E7017_04725 [Alphaproteobacteria bacterium]|nr:hypothetical protein [Alphaproteobacteria bacterium]
MISLVFSKDARASKVFALAIIAAFAVVVAVSDSWKFSAVAMLVFFLIAKCSDEDNKPFQKRGELAPHCYISLLAMIGMALNIVVNHVFGAEWPVILTVLTVPMALYYLSDNLGK